MDAPVPVILCALLAAGALVLPGPRGRAWAMLGALVLSVTVLAWHVADNPALDPLTEHPSRLAAAIAGGVVVLVVGALIIDRRPWAFPLAAVAALPFRIPIESGGTTSNLLVPLYVVIGAGALAYVVPRLRGQDETIGVPLSEAPEDAAVAPRQEEHRAGWLERVLALALVLYAVQATYSDDFEHALENVVFFYVPFALLFVLLGRVRWTTRLAGACLLVLTALALAFAGIGFVEYATRHLLLNPKVIAANEFESYFRVNSLFFDPNIYGRFLAVVMVGITAFVLWTDRVRESVIATIVLAVLWAGLVLTFSQSSFVALLVGLAVLGGLRWDARRAASVAAVLLAAGVAFVALAPDAVHLDIGDSKSADSATSGRYDLIKGGLELFEQKPLEGQGSGAFARVYRREQKTSSQRAASASHTIPVTVAAEQGVPGLLVYLALLVLAFRRLLRGVRGALPRMALAAMFSAVVVHTMMYAAFLEDPLTWALLGVGVAFARRPQGPESGAPA
ncbi:MAG TPA: O-antigen ligase family protein [Solirubrobacteraceae bacterium]